MMELILVEDKTQSRKDAKFSRSRLNNGIRYLRSTLNMLKLLEIIIHSEYLSLCPRLQ